MKTKQFVWWLILCCMASFISNACFADQADDEAAIRKSDDAYVNAHNKHDANGLAALWSPEAVYVDPETNEEFIGREAIEKGFPGTLADSKDAKLEVDVKSIKFL